MIVILGGGPLHKSDLDTLGKTLVFYEPQGEEMIIRLS